MKHAVEHLRFPEAPVEAVTEFRQVTGQVLGQVSYAQLKSGTLSLDGKELPTVPLSSMVRAREVAQHLKQWIESGRFLLGEPVEPLPLNDEAPFLSTASRDS